MFVNVFFARLIKTSQGFDGHPNVVPTQKNFYFVTLFGQLINQYLALLVIHVFFFRKYFTMPGMVRGSLFKGVRLSGTSEPINRRSPLDDARRRNHREAPLINRSPKNQEKATPAPLGAGNCLWLSNIRGYSL